MGGSLAYDYHCYYCYYYSNNDVIITHSHTVFSIVKLGSEAEPLVPPPAAPAAPVEEAPGSTVLGLGFRV